MSGLRPGIKIDHVATVRQATMPDSNYVESDPVAIASIREGAAGAYGITTDPVRKQIDAASDLGAVGDSCFR